MFSIFQQWHLRVIGVCVCAALSVSACASSSGAATQTTPTATPTTASMLYMITPTTSGTGSGGLGASLDAIATATGAQVWQAHIQGTVATSPVVAQGKLFLSSVSTTVSNAATPGATPTVSFTSQLNTFDAHTGQLLHQQTLPNAVFGTLIAANSLLLGIRFSGVTSSQTQQATVVALDPASGATRWQRALKAGFTPGAANVAVGHGIVVAASVENLSTGISPGVDLNAFAIADGSPLWQIHQATSLVTMQATSTALYLGLMANATPGGGPPLATISALDITTGKAMWQRPFGGAGNLVLATDQHVIVMQDEQPAKSGALPGKLLALNPSTGAVQWSSPFQVNDTGTPTVIAINDTLFGLATPTNPKGGSTPANTSIFALHLATGALIWNDSLPLEQQPIAIIGDPQRVYVIISGPSSQLRAINAVDGKIVWQFPLTGFGQLPPVLG